MICQTGLSSYTEGDVLATTGHVGDNNPAWFSFIFFMASNFPTAGSRLKSRLINIQLVKKSLSILSKSQLQTLMLSIYFSPGRALYWKQPHNKPMSHSPSPDVDTEKDDARTHEKASCLRLSNISPTMIEINMRLLITLMGVGIDPKFLCL